MPKNKKKFIDKKLAVTFHLVHRSQQDPLIADEKAPQHVLVPQKSKFDLKNRKEEQKKYGIYYDDDYDYLQHLRERGTSVNHWEQTKEVPKSRSKLKLPSSVFASEVEEDVGLLNKAAPQGLRLDLDPDIVAAMDEDFDYDNPDNILQDDFIQIADGVISDDESNKIYMGSDNENDYGEVDNRSDQMWSSDEEDERYDDVGSLDNEDMKSTKSRFTEYSMSSSVIKRNKQLTLLDDRFEQMFASYDENEIGALDCDEIEGEIDLESEMLKQCADEFEKERTKEELKQDHSILTHYNQESDDSDDNFYEEMDKIEVKEKQQWDCESMLSLHSNLYNHPKLIMEPPKIRLDKRGVPVIRQRLTAKVLAQLDDCKPSTGPGSLASAVSTLSIRPKGETPEQRRQRKQALKQHRQERRQERKMNSIAFKEEKKKMEKNILNNKVNLQVSIV
ncbi:LTV1 ribosome biogenesis factor [Lycorma delicatula]|uniref:LTV1 ribosome biogenesis factor n=1 Tax=Lycorma delicatula TaxID=130591 RepID=UPI003F50F2F5